MLFTWLICLSFQGTFLMTQAVAKVMVDQGVKNGSIVNLASIVGKVRKIYTVCFAVKPIAWKSIGSCSIDDGDGNKNVKTARIIKQNNKFACASCFFVHFFAVAAWLWWKMPNFTFYQGCNKWWWNFLSLSKLECGPQEINSRKICPHYAFSVNWNKRDKVWKMLIHFKSDVFTSVAVIIAKTPYLTV